MADEELLLKMKAYIEHMEEKIEFEWGYSRSLQELIDDGHMPDLYWEICNNLRENR